MDETGVYQGFWRRLLIARPGAPVDTYTYVAWLQGPGLFGDLRQPVGLEARIQASCLNELTHDEALALAGQEGFAGAFSVAGEEAEWTRALDYQPPAALRDRGRLEREGELLIEHGLEADYIEYWQRAPETADGCAAARLVCDADGRQAFLIQCGTRFLYARDRDMALPRGAMLADLVRAADADAARALVDCEISIGTITADGWRIERSTLPWRTGAVLLSPDSAWRDGTLIVADMDAHGLPAARVLRAMETEGAFIFRAPAAVVPIDAMRRRPQDGKPFREVPVVDVSALDSGDAAAERAVAAQLREAACEVGFLHVTGHGIAPEVIARLRAATKMFFDQDRDAKMRSYIGGSTNHRGYVPEGEEVFSAGGKDKKEAFDLAFDLPAEAVAPGHPMLGPNRWPDLPGFREDVMAYYAAAYALGRRLLHGFAMALGRPADAFDHLVTTPPSQLRLIHYPYDADAHDVQGIGAHTDYECFTLLLATAPGLEVMNSAGEWIDAPPVEGGLVVNIGDMMEYWSGGEFVATSHRVRKVAEERYAFPLFFAVDYDMAIRPLSTSAGAGAPAISAGAHLYAQTLQTFRYLKERVARGEIAMPPEARPLSSFGQEYRRSRQAQG